MKYKINELTPKNMMCVVGSCPAIYEVEEANEESSK